MQKGYRDILCYFIAQKSWISWRWIGVELTLNYSVDLGGYNLHFQVPFAFTSLTRAPAIVLWTLPKSPLVIYNCEQFEIFIPVSHLKCPRSPNKPRLSQTMLLQCCLGLNIQSYYYFQVENHMNHAFIFHCHPFERHCLIVFLMMSRRLEGFGRDA